MLNNCPTYPGNQWCEQIRGGSAQEPLIHDSRIKAVFAADPTLGSEFTSNGLKNVAVPVTLWGSELGGDGVFPKDVAKLEADLPQRPDFQIAKGAGHFAFLAPCSDAFRKMAIEYGEGEICIDNPGFDRVAFHRQLNDAAVEFFRRNLLDSQ